MIIYLSISVVLPLHALICLPILFVPSDSQSEYDACDIGEKVSSLE